MFPGLRPKYSGQVQTAQRVRPILDLLLALSESTSHKFFLQTFHGKRNFAEYECRQFVHGSVEALTCDFAKQSQVVHLGLAAKITGSG